MNPIFSLRSSALVLSCMVALSACGGGDAANTSVAPDAVSKYDSTPFQGIWKRRDGTGSGNRMNCFQFHIYGGTYGGLNKPILIKDDIVTYAVEVYSDRYCRKYLGKYTAKYSVEFNASEVGGASTVARALITLTGFSVDPDGAEGFRLQEPPKIGEVSKQIFGVEGNLMYVGNPASAADIESYPTRLHTPAIYERLDASAKAMTHPGGAG